MKKIKKVIVFLSQSSDFFPQTWVYIAHFLVFILQSEVVVVVFSELWEESHNCEIKSQLLFLYCFIPWQNQASMLHIVYGENHFEFSYDFGVKDELEISRLCSFVSTVLYF